MKDVTSANEADPRERSCLMFAAVPESDYGP
jgi:hypothetical protein